MKELLDLADYIRKLQNGFYGEAMEVVAVSGHFSVFHIGHLRYLQAASDLGHHLLVIVNNDNQIALKGGTPFMNEQERLALVSALTLVDFAVLSIDDDRSVSNTLEILRPNIFANGGDVQKEEEVREAEVCRKYGIQMAFGVGGTDKIQSSSELIRRAAKHYAAHNF